METIRFRYHLRVTDQKVTVVHTDGITVEVVKLARAEARRLVEHEQAAGREAFIVPEGT